MADFNIRSDSVNVEQIMQQIRARIREKRGVDYTEEQIRELAAVKLERFLDPQKVRSGLLEQFRKGGISPVENYSFEDTTLFESHRAPLRWIRRLLRPILKLFLNPNPLIHVLHMQAGINTRHAQYTEISYELLHNLVLESTRLGIEVKNLKMRVESMSGRFDFAERRARALEGIVQYRPEEKAAEPPARGRTGQAPPPPGPPSQGPAAPAGPAAAGRDAAPADGSDARRKRRRRRGRRGGTGRAPGELSQAGGDAADAPEDGAQPAGGDPSSGSGGRGDEPANGSARPDAPADPQRDEQ
jgi:hypothetical protein